MPSSEGRKRSRRACETCRELKRKCDGAEPCGTCVRFEYDCAYSKAASGRRSRKATDVATASSPATQISLPSPLVETGQAIQNSNSRIRSLEANSGAAFLRRLALRIDANNAPRMHTFAWNSFLGKRTAGYTPVSRLICEILSEREMKSLADVYYEKLDPVYGFVDRGGIDKLISNRWTYSQTVRPEDAVLCGIAALGYLFSQVQAGSLELDLAESARSVLERSMFEPPTATSITAWVLRVVYLRLTETPHIVWMASCMLMHMIEAAGLQYECAQGSILHPCPQTVNPEIRKRLVAVAQHLNTWVSFDMGRSRVTPGNVTDGTLSAPLGDRTVEIAELLPYSIILDPERASNVSELESALASVLQRVHSSPPSILAQVNLMLCLCRRLQSMNIAFQGSTLDQVLSLSSRGIQAAQDLLEERTPWHHMVNVPFHVVCVLLAIDTLSSTPQLRHAMHCLNSVAAVYKTEATQEALRTASLLISLHQKWKEKCAANLSDVLRMCPITSNIETQDGSSQLLNDANWLDGILGDLSTIQQFDLDRLLTPAPPWETDVNSV
ncbi:hypothetical protein JX265_002231 [Neoarthrinium moseri]|uniref:Zn(2)-C6 fungal-type domain-containing protein n=2 Tax=Neoarthrinium moseri TaxID=1658444 RepID=A0A9P9WTX3_9PEZI|nr:hypothetical protein JX265_002231 [Neoarthrinium moseri]